MHQFAGSANVASGIPPMQPRLSLVTPGTRDLDRSRRFYEALGFTASPASQGDVVFFQFAGGAVLSLFPRHLLAKDAGLADAQRRDSRSEEREIGDRAIGDRHFGGITLAHNVQSASEVDLVLAEAASAGARILKPGGQAFWGGYTGYLADPDGHPWEVAWNPHFAVDVAGGIALP